MRKRIQRTYKNSFAGDAVYSFAICGGHVFDKEMDFRFSVLFESMPRLFDFGKIRAIGCLSSPDFFVIFHFALAGLHFVDENGQLFFEFFAKSHSHSHSKVRVYVGRVRVPVNDDAQFVAHFRKSGCIVEF